MTRRIIYGRVSHTLRKGPVEDVEVRLIRQDTGADLQRTQTDKDGLFRIEIDCDDGIHIVKCEAFGVRDQHGFEVVGDHDPGEIFLNLALGYNLTVLSRSRQDERLLPAAYAVVNRRIVVRAETSVDAKTIAKYLWPEPKGAVGKIELEKEVELIFDSPGVYVVESAIVEQKADRNPAIARMQMELMVSEADTQKIGGHINVTLDRSPSNPTLDQALWVAIRDRTDAISFENYRKFILRVLRAEAGDEEATNLTKDLRERTEHFRSVGAYHTLKYLTEAFLLLQCGVKIGPRRGQREFDPRDETARLGAHYSHEEITAILRRYLGDPPPQLPYIKRVLDAAFPDSLRPHQEISRALTAHGGEPLFIELIHTYFLEEGMLMQTINAISQRFQNVRASGDRDPLANLEIAPLWPLSHLVWGLIQSEPSRLTVRRRALEYSHEYGLMLFGRVTSGLEPADNRSSFLAALHNLLYRSMQFFKEDFQTTVISDGYPLLNALKEVHLVLANGAGNQFGDLPWAARVETLIVQFMLAQPEFRSFLQSRVMVPYKEEWMPQVDAMKSLQGWSDVTVSHFRDLAVYGEQLLLSVRWGDWIDINDEASAKNWARYWRPEIQGYLHAYRAATGVDLTATDAIDATIPAVHLQRRLAAQRARLELPGALAAAPAVGLLEPSRRTNFSNK